MEIDFQKRMSILPDEELQKYIDGYKKFNPEAVKAAISELQKRGRTITETELATINHEFKQQMDDFEKDEKNSRYWTKNIVTDENAPAFYSERTISIITSLFSALFGSILMATNFRSMESKKGVVEVVIFGVFYTSLQFYILSMFPRNYNLFLLLNIGGSLILHPIFWRNYIGKDTKYRAKPIWTPLLIGISIVAIFLLINIYVVRIINLA